MSSTLSEQNQVANNNRSNILYISNIPKKIEKNQLSGLLNPFGPLLSLNIIYRGDFAFAFAEFDDLRDAAIAVKQLNQKMYCHRKLRVQFKNQKETAGQNCQGAIQDSPNESKSIKQSNQKKDEKQCTTQTSLNGTKQKIHVEKCQESVRKNNRNQKYRQNRNRSISRGQDIGKENDKIAQRSREKNNRRRENRQIYRKRSPSRQSKQYQQSGQIESYSNSRSRQQKNYVKVDKEQLYEIEEDIMHLESCLHRLYDRLDSILYKSSHKYDKEHKNRQKISRRRSEHH